MNVIPCSQADKEALAFIARSAGTTFLRGFVGAFGLRAGVAVLARIIHIARKRPTRLLSFSTLLDEKYVVFRVEASRLGLFVGSFSGVYHLLRLIFRYIRCRQERTEFSSTPLQECPNDARTRRDVFVAGCVASAISVSFLTPDMRHTMALYALARGLQSMAYVLDEKGWLQKLFPRLQTPWGMWDVYQFLRKHADALLFILSTSQIMYAYVMRRETLPDSYWKFIVRTGPTPPKILEAARHVADGDFPVPLEKLGLTENDMSRFAQTVPCAVLHPWEPQCRSVFFDVLNSTVRKSWLMYLSLNGFSYIVLGFTRFIKSPISSVLRAILTSARSTMFLALFVALYQATICAHHNAGLRDFKALYWVGGSVASLAIFLEKKSRREELGLYVLPRALDSLWQSMKIKPLPRGATILYALSMGVLIYYHEFSSEVLAPFLRYIFRTLLPSTRPKPLVESSKSPEQ